MKVLERILFPKLDWIQIEVSGLCNADCIYCPNSLFRQHWRGRNLDIKEFLRLKPFLRKSKLIYLQGWGEPFCNPQFFEFVRVAKEEGVMVGTTTNGTLIRDPEIEKIVDLGLDIIAFSVSGIKTNDQLRRGTSLERILKLIDRLNSRKFEVGSLNPKIHIAYMLLRSNLFELYDVPKTFSDRGIDHIVVSLLDYVANPTLKGEDLTPRDEEEYLRLEELFAAVSQEGFKRGLNISFNLSHPLRRNKGCSERPLRSMFINSLGYVSPCVYTGIPADTCKNLYFGNINERNLLSIWREKSYRAFRHHHQKQRFVKPCMDCNKLRIINLPL